MGKIKFDKILNELRESDANGGDSSYSGIAEITIGGITEGDVFVESTMQEMWDQLIKQEKNPVLTAPSSTFTSSITGLREVGEIINITFNSSFNRGNISPQYTAESPYRSGLPNEYQFIGTGLVNQLKTTLTDSQIVSNYIVVINGQSWQGRVAYDAGVQPKTSYGSDYSIPLPAGETSYITNTITGVYPYFATTVDITTMTKQNLAIHGSAITVDLVLESITDKQSLEIPEIWGSLIKLEQWNTLSNSWDIINTNTFTVSDITKDIQGNTVNYKKFLHNGSQIGARRLRFTF